MMNSNALITIDFQLPGIGAGSGSTHIYIMKDGLRSDITLAVQRHDAKPSDAHQAHIAVNELIAFGELCVELGSLFLKREER